MSDRIQLQQLVLNLIANAMEAMSSVTGRPRVLQLTSQNREQEVRIAATDTGPGVDRKAIDQIFKPVFTTKSRGMGLGLWNCRTIMEDHNGRLRSDSEPDRGSVFRIISPNEVRRAPRRNRLAPRPLPIWTVETLQGPIDA